ncbi:MAG: glycosyltransferase, partial [Chthoniobacterales bacterium]
HLVVSTYPIYGFVKDELARKGQPLKSPFYTIVTDSTQINSAWYRRISDAFVVPDAPTKDCLIRGGIKEDTIEALGFPVSLRFEKLHPLTAEANAPWKILVMPSTRRSVALRILKTVLARPDTTVTVIAGRNKSLIEALQNSPLGSDPRCEILGWTDQMPELLASHHLFIGKAGGATVQEAIAAQCPILISHVVPGQEEGNIALILQSRIGMLANTSGLLKSALDLAFGDDAAEWRDWKRNIACCSKCGASRNIARFLLSAIKA